MAQTYGYGIQLKGKLGGLVFVKTNDGMIVRTAPGRRKAASWSDKQKEQRERFRMARFFYKQLKEEFVNPIWKLAATPPLTGYNLFLSSNIPAFDAMGKITDESLVHLSAGVLSLPHLLQAERLPGEPAEISVSWDSRCNNATDSPDDELCLVCTTSAWSAHLTRTGALRSAGSYRFTLPRLMPNNVPSLWLFFRSKEGTCYSEDKYFKFPAP